VKQLRYTLSFTTPAFMGNADQNAQWRTPPIKHLLREWWRVAYAADKNFAVRVDEMRREEGLLFGMATDGESRKSLVRIRLDRWNMGEMRNWQALESVSHPEVKFPVGSDLYMGFGPLTLPRGAKQPALKANAAIQAEEAASLSIAVPEIYSRLIERALWLIDKYGTLGGRSRNGWGAFMLTPINDTPVLTGQTPQRDWCACLDRDWSHAIGRDEKAPLIWQTAPHNDWKTLMKTLAEIKIGLRTQFKFTTGKNAEAPESRHWLSYPVTNHSVQNWDNNARLPNTLRFKVRKTDAGKIVGVIFHVPHLPPRSFNPHKREIENVWQRVHAFLDAPAQNLTRISE
jgi:CRISPR-associated protein Cmr1